jgi:DNA-binding CsgD family transcriptional regulator
MRLLYQLPALLGNAEVPAALIVDPGTLCASNVTLRERMSEDESLGALLDRVARGDVAARIDAGEGHSLPGPREFRVTRDQRLETETRQYRIIEYTFPQEPSVRLLVCRLTKGNIAPVSMLRRKWQLTEQEARVARYVAQGRSNRAIGRELGISERTVRHHIEHVMRKLDVGSRTEAAHLIWSISGR